MSKNSAAGAGLDRDGDGYTNIEEYLNDTDPRRGMLPIDLFGSVLLADRPGSRPGKFEIHRTGNRAAPHGSVRNEIRKPGAPNLWEHQKRNRPEAREKVL